MPACSLAFPVSASPPDATKPMASSHHFAPPRQVSAGLVRLFEALLFSSSLVRNVRLCCLVQSEMSEYKGRFAVNMNIKSSIAFTDTVDAFTATCAV